jgi:hypothetical protein
MAKVGGKREGAGRKKGIPNKATFEIRTAAQKYTGKAVETIYDLMLNGESEQVRLAAAKELIDRGHGKSPQSVEHTGEGGTGPIRHKIEVEFVSTKKDSK